MVKQRVAAETAVDEAGKAKIISESSRYLRIYFGQNQDRDVIQRQVSVASLWAERNGVSPQRIWVGEFGALGDIYGYQAAAPEDRQRWFSDARSVFEQFGFGWAVWNYCCAMGIIEGETSGPLDPGIVRALGLKPSGRS
jgi:endoglucanase